MLVFKLELPETQPTTATELCLVRKMALKPRGAPPRTQYLAAEKRTAHDELGPHNKLGDLWTWATSHTASRGKFVVFPAQIILQTVPMERPHRNGCGMAGMAEAVTVKRLA